MWQFTFILKTWASLNYPNEMLGKQHLLCFYSRKRANIWCQYIANLRGVWCDTFISICKQSKHQSTSDAGRAGLQTDTKLSYLHKDFHAEYRKVQHKGMIDERRSWCKNYGYLHHHFFYPEGRAIIGGASSSSNMLTGYILFTQARPARAQAEILSPACMLWSRAAQCRFEQFWHQNQLVLLSFFLFLAAKAAL